jgi:hypothetical protein
MEKPTAIHESLPEPLPRPQIHTDYDGTNIYINISQADGGATGRGILIGMLSAFGSAVCVVLLLALIYFFRYTTRGRILLDRVGRPGQYDDEQAMLREEAEALEAMDELQRSDYLRAKGTSKRRAKSPSCGIRGECAAEERSLSSSIHTSQSAGDDTDRYISISVSGDTRERRLGVGV